MTNQDGGSPQSFVATKSYRRFGEMCDACRRARVVGLGYGPPGTGKTESAKQYAQWNLFKPFLPETLITFTGRNTVDDLYPYRPLTFASAPLDTSMQQCRTVFYTPPVSASVARIEKQVLTLFAAFSYLVEATNQHHQGEREFVVTRRYTPIIELLIVDEANRLKDAGLELMYIKYNLNTQREGIPRMSHSCDKMQEAAGFITSRQEELSHGRNSLGVVSARRATGAGTSMAHDATQSAVGSGHH